MASGNNKHLLPDFAVGAHHKRAKAGPLDDDDDARGAVTTNKPDLRYLVYLETHADDTPFFRDARSVVDQILFGCATPSQVFKHPDEPVEHPPNSLLNYLQPRELRNLATALLLSKAYNPSGGALAPKPAYCDCDGKIVPAAPEPPAHPLASCLYRLRLLRDAYMDVRTVSDVGVLPRWCDWLAHLEHSEVWIPPAWFMWEHSSVPYLEPYPYRSNALPLLGLLIMVWARRRFPGLDVDRARALLDLSMLHKKRPGEYRRLAFERRLKVTAARYGVLISTGIAMIAELVNEVEAVYYESQRANVGFRATSFAGVADELDSLAHLLASSDARGGSGLDEAWFTNAKGEAADRRRALCGPAYAGDVLLGHDQFIACATRRTETIMPTRFYPESHIEESCMRCVVWAFKNHTDTPPHRWMANQTTNRCCIVRVCSVYIDDGGWRNNTSLAYCIRHRRFVPTSAHNLRIIASDIPSSKIWFTLFTTTEPHDSEPRAYIVEVVRVANDREFALDTVYRAKHAGHYPTRETVVKLARGERPLNYSLFYGFYQ